MDTLNFDTSLNAIKKQYGIFIDLNICNTIQEALQFSDENAYDDIVNSLMETNKYDNYHQVGIRQKDGTIENSTFSDLKLYFFK